MGPNYKKDDFLFILNPWKWAVLSFGWKRFPVLAERVQKFKHLSFEIVQDSQLQSRQKSLHSRLKKRWFMLNFSMNFWKLQQFSFSSVTIAHCIRENTTQHFTWIDFEILPKKALSYNCGWCLLTGGVMNLVNSQGYQRDQIVSFIAINIPLHNYITYFT